MSATYPSPHRVHNESGAGRCVSLRKWAGLRSEQNPSNKFFRSNTGAGKNRSSGELAPSTPAVAARMDYSVDPAKFPLKSSGDFSTQVAYSHQTLPKNRL